MRKTFVPYIQQVPQWKQCYYNISTQKYVISLSRKSQLIQQRIRDRLNYLLFKQSTALVYQQQQDVRLMIQSLCRQLINLQNQSKQINIRFYMFSYKQMEKIYYFVQYKCFEIKEKYERLKFYEKVADKADSGFMVLLENTYIEVHYLLRMIKYNRGQENYCINQYETNLFEYQTQSHHKSQLYNMKMDRMEKQVDKIQKQLQRMYLVHNKNLNIKSGIKYILTINSINKDKAYKQTRYTNTYQLGFIMGILFCLFAALIFLKQYHNITLQTNKSYAGYFPVWRGASYFIFYQWILGFVFLFLESTQINYKLVLGFENQTLPRSKELFFSAQIMTIIYMGLFLLYMLDMAEVINNKFEYYGHVMWLVLIIYYLIPIPFTNHYHSTMYFLKLMFQVLISITPLIRCNPLIIWLSQQIVSFSQPFADFAYSICKLQNIKSQCKQIPTVTFIILAVFFSYRIIQNFRMYYQSGWKIIPPFWGLWRALMGLVTSITSYYYRKEIDNITWLVIWIITAAITTIVATFVDFKGDWGLLNGSLLRKKLIFGDTVYFYYICMFIDFCLRANWALNISPNVIRNFNVLPYYLIMIVSYLQLFRRCMWNLFRIQFDHAINCDKFQAIIDDAQIESELKLKYKDQIKLYKINNNNNQNKDEKQTEDIRKKAQYQLVTACIKSQQTQAEEMISFIRKKHLKVNQISHKISHFI